MLPRQAVVTKSRFQEFSQKVKASCVLKATLQLDGNHLDTSFHAQDPRVHKPALLRPQSLRLLASRNPWMLPRPCLHPENTAPARAGGPGEPGSGAESWWGAASFPGEREAGPSTKCPSTTSPRPRKWAGERPAETLKPAGDAASRSQSRASGPCVTARPTNGSGPGCRFLPTGSPAAGEGLPALPAAEEQSPRTCPPGAGPGECSGGPRGGTGALPPLPRLGRFRGAVAAFAPRRGEVGRGCACALSRTRCGAPPPVRHPPPPERDTSTSLCAGVTWEVTWAADPRVQRIELRGACVSLLWAVVRANLLAVGLAQTDGQGPSLRCYWWQGRGPTCRPSAPNQSEIRMTAPMMGAGSSS